MLRFVPGIVRLRWPVSGLVLALVCGALAPHDVCRAAPAEVPADPAPDVMTADREYAQLALESGIRAAYDLYLEPDAVVFRPLPVTAREWLVTHEPASGRLEWEPLAARTSCDASLAVTFGTWRYVAPNSSTADTGHYLTAWHRSEGTDWRIVLDQSLNVATLPAMSSGSAAPCDGSTSVADKLLAADRKVNGGLRNLHVNEARPIAVRALTGGTVTGSAQADLALTHGQLVDRKAARGAEPQVRAVYVRVWQRDGRGWRLLHDFVSSVSP